MYLVSERGWGTTPSGTAPEGKKAMVDCISLKQKTSHLMLVHRLQHCLNVKPWGSLLHNKTQHWLNVVCCLHWDSTAVCGGGGVLGSTGVGIGGRGSETPRAGEHSLGEGQLLWRQPREVVGLPPRLPTPPPPIRPRGRFIKRSTPAANPFRVIHRPLYTRALSTHTTLQSFILKINYRLFSLLACSSHVPRAWACQTDCGPVLVYCWARIADDDPTISQDWANVLGGVPQSSHTTGECFFNQW